ncbi:MAG TPA: hypothetical protein VG273_18845 [Bryobacteraceae bacterium]|jgi:flavin reductase (DIM6/NTAB) family NADH-FMN oxidoreductase RutF|nr:hypothetical protein [Bryobacteraceae bacterium]
MSIAGRARAAIRKLALGETALPQECTLGLIDPQTEITVWLHGAGQPIDVTQRHAPASSGPFAVCISLDKSGLPPAENRGRLSLGFRERNGQQRLLGEIGLKPGTAQFALAPDLHIFEARTAANYCLPQRQLWTHYLLHEYSHWRHPDTSGISMSFLDKRATIVMMIRPHPVMLASIETEGGGNIFPMNIMGDLGHDRIGFVLKESRSPADLVGRAGRLALTSVPVSQKANAYRLAGNHYKQSIEWQQLPFAVRKSATFRIPVPDFALRVRELEVETANKIGNQWFFVARVVHDENVADGPGLCMIHGFYQAWRLKKMGVS